MVTFPQRSLDVYFTIKNYQLISLETLGKELVRHYTSSDKLFVEIKSCPEK